MDKSYENLSNLQFFDKYSRFDRSKGRRERWPETVARLMAFLREVSQDKLSEEEYQMMHDAVLNKEVMPAMRLLATAGDTARRNNFAAYNCTFVGIDSVQRFSEILVILMNGAGAGYSVEYKYISKLPVVDPYTAAQPLEKRLTPEQHLKWANEQRGWWETVTIEDTTEGWGAAVRFAMSQWFSGRDVNFDYSQIRPAGAELVTKGGTASGPEPLQELIEFAREIMIKARGRYLTALEVSDIINKIGMIVVSGGHRRSSEIALYDVDDEEMRLAKFGNFEEQGHGHRHAANFSAVWPAEGVTREQFDAQWDAMIAGGRGEPGIFNLRAVLLGLPYRRQVLLEQDDYLDKIGTNPCGEIAMRHGQTCNLTSVVVRPEDTFGTLARKVALATLFGTVQSMLDNFPGFDPLWRDNQQRERLLGVDLNGVMSNKLVRDPLTLEHLRDLAVTVNQHYAGVLGINASAAVTTVKPSGNSSVFLGTSPGIHPWFAPYYVRNVRIGVHTKMYQLLKMHGVPMVPDLGGNPKTTVVASFPVKAPEEAITMKQLSAVEQAEIAVLVKRHWAEHQVSVTVNYWPHEVDELREWVWEHQDEISGMSFLPHANSDYFMLPYEEIDAEEYAWRVKEMPEINWDLLGELEQGVNESNASTVAGCEGDKCTFVPKWM